jgi:hypothetical protein
MDMKADKKSTLLCLHGMLGSKTNFRSIVKNVGISDHIKDVYLVDLRYDILCFIIPLGIMEIRSIHRL